MKILFLCGIFGKEIEQDLIRAAKKTLEYSANVFQEKMISGFEKCGTDIEIVSAPFAGSFPNASRILKFDAEKYHNNSYQYVSFNNIWGIRNFSRARVLKKKVKAFARQEDPRKLIVVYSPHTPFLEAAVYAKKIDPSIRICLVVPDLPQYMNLSAKISMAYKVAKKIDIARFEKLNKYVDSYMLLTEQMKDKLHVDKRPYLVVEGIVDPDTLEKKAEARGAEEKYIVYTGKTNLRFGVKKLVDAFISIPDPKLRLVLCGKGDCDRYIADMAKQDSRIMVMGQLSHEEACRWISAASVLVNPRENDEEYTKYSFPSKNIEYLASGNPTVGYLLDGMPEIYRDLMIVADQDGLAAAICKALNSSAQEEKKRMDRVRAHLQTLYAQTVAERIVEITYPGE